MVKTERQVRLPALPHRERARDASFAAGSGAAVRGRRDDPQQEDEEGASVRSRLVPGRRRGQGGRRTPNVLRRPALGGLLLLDDPRLGAWRGSPGRRGGDVPGRSRSPLVEHARRVVADLMFRPLRLHRRGCRLPRQLPRAASLGGPARRDARRRASSWHSSPVRWLEVERLGRTSPPRPRCPPAYGLAGQQPFYAREI